MIEQYLDLDRKKVIDTKVNTITSNYLKDEVTNLLFIARDMGLLVLETNKIAIPKAVETYSGKQAILMPKNYYFSTTRKISLAHEMGHMILGHLGKRIIFERDPIRSGLISEAEATYFSERLLGLKVSYLTNLIESFILVLTNPIVSFRDTFDLNAKNLSKLVKIINETEVNN